MSLSSVTLHDVASTLRAENLLNEDDATLEYLKKRRETAISTRGVPKYLSSDNDPLFLYHQWQANLRILSVDELKTVRRNLL